jgi:beta-lactamase class A
MAMLDLLRLIDTGDALSPASRWLLLDMMRRCATGSNRIRGLLPQGTVVEHKTGTLAGYTGDVGFLTLPDGRRIAVVFFARGGSNRPAVISTAARAIYDAFCADGPAAQLGDRAVQAASGQAAGAGRPQSGPSSSACMLGGEAVQARC